MIINKAFEIIEDHSDDADFIGEIKEQIIDSAEAALNVKFPMSYRLFLKKYGLGDIFGEEIYGLGIEENGVPSMTWITKHFRREEGLPNHLICFYFTGYDGVYLCLDCSKVQNQYDDNAEVVSFVSGLPIKEQNFEVEAGSFGEFLLNTLQESMEKS
ncbi:SMI1/KNR4 family protein [Fictibacillus nanhaiensis]|uniref:SMI1/KNR4 family protein n=1 Tax=Fictibacillus nanhaiensis TaxID=742169 RepID=A0ABS2ZTX3_9BACL|nr:SMI1/KNR4 family protein [Fictibacillus nanhaiensis]